MSENDFWIWTSDMQEENDNKCIACNGTGYYDDTNSPKCESCNGTGKEIEQESGVQIYKTIEKKENQMVYGISNKNDRFKLYR